MIETISRAARRSMLAFLAALTALLAVASPAMAQDNSWWNDDWGYRRGIVIDTTPAGVNLSGPIGRTPVLVRLSGTTFGFGDALQNGADLRFIDTDGRTPLPFHIESFDQSAEVATVWVSVPNLNGGEQRQIWVYYGNANAPTGEDAGGTFDPDQIAVFHFGDAAGQPAADRTANRNNAQNAPPGLVAGIAGQAARFQGQGELVVPESPSLALPAGGPFTLAAWVQPATLSGEQAIFARGPMVVGLANGTPFVAIGAGRTQAGAVVQQGQWTHIAVASDGTAIRLYVNGVEAGAASVVTPDLTGPLLIGGAPGRPFTGLIDEVRVSKTARPALMLQAMAQAETQSSRFVTISETAEEPGEGGGGVLWFIVSKIHTLDAVIIGLCMLLLGLAIAVMVAKTRYLNAAERGNRAFMKRFREMHEELVPIDQIEGISPKEVAFINDSPLGRIYKEGIEELDVRRKFAANRPLSGEAVEAMRAAVDAVVVDENQKLDKWMVILTIAISGGPFIGLLGTVIGVMSTFGGVAMAGDVNVNAIAPGIAAALLATIAGLAAAIPSLFGYNYLNGRISTLADDMRVFVDRLITRLAEMQADAAYTPPPMRMAAE